MNPIFNYDLRPKNIRNESKPPLNNNVHIYLQVELVVGQLGFSFFNLLITFRFLGLVAQFILSNYSNTETIFFNFISIYFIIQKLEFLWEII